jgi:hypothetical protein
MSVTVSWVSDGLCYQWCAQSEWIGPLLMEIDAAVENAEAEADAEHEKSINEYRTAFQAAVSALVESPKFRGEQLGKRRLVAPSILAEAGVEIPRRMPELGNSPCLLESGPPGRPDPVWRGFRGGRRFEKA